MRENSALRGRLVEIFLPAILANNLDELGIRLGSRAAIATTVSGTRTTSDPASLQPFLTKTYSLLDERNASFERSTLVVGAEHDVLEGTLTFTQKGSVVDRPCAVFVTRRPDREIDVFLLVQVEGRSSFGPSAEAIVSAQAKPNVPVDVAEMIGACRMGDSARVISFFEQFGTVRAGDGSTFSAGEGGVRAFFEALFSRVRWIPNVHRCLDDGRKVALLCSFESSDFMLVFERGDSGLLRTLTVYGSLEPLA